MILDLNPGKCTGCMACALYCSLAHEGWVIPRLSRIHILSGRGRQTIVPVACIPCEERACLSACPEPGAIHLDEDGRVMIEEKLCTACAKCARACQIGAIHIHRLPGRGKKGKAVALKCDLCGGNPWCARVCPSGAILAIDGQTASQAAFDRILAACHALEAGKGGR